MTTLLWTHSLRLCKYQQFSNFNSLGRSYQGQAWPIEIIPKLQTHCSKLILKVWIWKQEQPWPLQLEQPNHFTLAHKLHPQNPYYHTLSPTKNRCKSRRWSSCGHMDEHLAGTGDGACDVFVEMPARTPPSTFGLIFGVWDGERGGVLVMLLVCRGEVFCYTNCKWSSGVVFQLSNFEN